MKATTLLAAAAIALSSSTADAQLVIGTCKIEPKAQCANAKLVLANLKGANLAGANLSGADLDEADLSGANLTNADLRRANLVTARLVGTILSGANLSGAQFLERRDSYGAAIGKTCAEGSIGACK